MLQSAPDISRINKRTEELLRLAQLDIYKNTDRLFVKLMIFQWLFGILISLIVSPRAWEGGQSSVHLHVWASIFLGGSIFLLPVLFGILKPGKVYTRYSIAIAQMLYSGLLIHLTGGRIETHFHIFGSLAFLAFYRDWKVLIIATVVTTLDHFIRGVYWPLSIFGVLTAGPLRWVEHAAWVVFEVIVLVRTCIRSLFEMKKIAQDKAELEAKNEQLNKAMEEIQSNSAQLVQSEKMKAMYEIQREFTSTVSHELRTPLASIKTAIDLVVKKMVGEINPEQAEVLGRAKSNVDRLKRLIDDILDLSKMESGKLQMNFMTNDIHKIIEEVIESQKDVAQSRGLFLKTEFDKQIPKIQFDSDRMIQVLNNLLNNAIKFTKTGSITVMTKNNIEGDHIVVSVKDTGDGIAVQDLPKLFQKFQQVESTVENEEGGTGLGLAICKEIITRHGGKIWVESKLGEGTVFYFTLPKQKKGI